MRPKFVQRVQLLQLFLSRFGLSLRAQRNSQVIVRIFKVGFQLDRLLEGIDCSAAVSAGLKLLAEVVLRFRIFWVDFARLAKLSERAGMVALTTQRNAYHQVRWRETRIREQNLAKLGCRSSQIADLSFNQAQLKMQFLSRLDLQRAAQ